MHHLISEECFPLELLDCQNIETFQALCRTLPPISLDEQFEKIDASELFFAHVVRMGWSFTEAYLLSLRGDPKGVAQLIDFMSKIILLLDDWQIGFCAFVEKQFSAHSNNDNELWGDAEVRSSLFMLALSINDFDGNAFSDKYLSHQDCHVSISKMINNRYERGLPWLISTVTSLPESEAHPYVDWYMNAKTATDMTELRAANIIHTRSIPHKMGHDAATIHFVACFCAIVATQEAVMKAFRQARSVASIKSLMAVYGPTEPSVLLNQSGLTASTRSMVLEILAESL